jgi:hypothetical protein
MEITTLVEVLNPTTGEILSLDRPTGELGRYLLEVREFEQVLREHKNLVTRELLARLDKDASWTLYEDGLKIVGQSPAPVKEWDGAELRSALLGLVDEGVLSIEAVDAAVETIVTYKPRKAGIGKLRKLGGRVKATVDELARESEPRRSVTVSGGRAA